MTTVPNSYEFNQERRYEAKKAKQIADKQEKEQLANGARYVRRDEKTIVLSK